MPIKRLLDEAPDITPLRRGVEAFRQQDVLALIESGKPACEIHIDGEKFPGNVRSAYWHAIKKLGLEDSVRASLRGGRLFLIRIER